ncbi:MAG: glutamine-synthetase adenylyltransferase [Bryobacterales bacterium]|nr:glutamine-synthetase adenylyltransferase [Bryobacteraceae bacterium]MDW8353923.1 glutamine-synthetase adenylyltransferase [Bryobacterales bacterium]
MQHLLEAVKFRDPDRAAARVASLAAELPEGVRVRLQSLLAACPDPDEALHYLDRLRAEHPDSFLRLSASASGLQYLVTVFAYSRFLSEELVKHPEWLEELAGSPEMHRMLSPEEYRERLERILSMPGVPEPRCLAVFRRRQILRILLRDVLGFATLAEATEELSNLADAVLEVVLRRIRQDLVRRHGAPLCTAPGDERRESGFAVIALGKLGGRGLNYSSDIDLMFLYEANGETDGPVRISNKEFFKKVANHYTELLSTYTSEGMCYRVDLRLRPEGRWGEVCVSLDGAKHYYRTRARDWELQMLIKARVAAGDRWVGREFLEFVEPLIYATTLDFSAVEALAATRDRISEKLAARRKNLSDMDIKLARGGIRDIEFLVQCLQRLHGGREPWVRHGGTLLALARLRDKDLLSDSEYSRLATAYQFLRHLEHRLQFDEDRQTHTLPSDPEELEILARKMPPSLMGSSPSASLLLQRLNHHLEEVQEIYERVIHAQQPIYYGAVASQTVAEAGMVAVEPPASNLVRFLDQRAPRLAAVVAAGRLERGQRYLEHFLEKVLDRPEWLGWLDGDATLARWILDLFEHSPYFAEQLIRTPELLAELKRVREHPAERPPFDEMAGAARDISELRRFFQRQMFRIQAESICLQAPIFTTLERTSELADAVIRVVYRMAIEHVLAAHPPVTSSYRPRDQMLVVALGRLGMLEFDLASDADLVFILPDADSAEMRFWTRVAERIIDLLTAYTGQGVMFAVDTRLRPNGREGPLVQLERGYKEYFAKHAEAWEGITYMKSRTVAGDIERGTEFLHELQDIDWRRYGQSGRSRKQLAQMRMRLEREQGPANPLKAGRGGYYDIDFALMYLRLKGAGIFYKVLNTPARIDVIEKMGHLERADADFLRDAATFYRAVDHGLRVSTGHAEGSLPTAPAQLDNLQELVCRWTPQHLHDQPLDVELAQIQLRTREFFDRLFQA